MTQRGSEVVRASKGIHPQFGETFERRWRFEDIGEISEHGDTGDGSAVTSETRIEFRAC